MERTMEVSSEKERSSIAVKGDLEADIDRLQNRLARIKGVVEQEKIKWKEASSPGKYGTHWKSARKKATLLVNQERNEVPKENENDEAFVLLQRRSPAQWQTDDVCAWLRRIQCDNFEKAVQSRKVNGVELMTTPLAQLRSLLEIEKGSMLWFQLLGKIAKLKEWTHALALNQPFETSEVFTPVKPIQQPDHGKPRKEQGKSKQPADPILVVGGSELCTAKEKATGTQKQPNNQYVSHVKSSKARQRMITCWQCTKIAPKSTSCTRENKTFCSPACLASTFIHAEANMTSFSNPMTFPSSFSSVPVHNQPTPSPSELSVSHRKKIFMASVSQAPLRKEQRHSSTQNDGFDRNRNRTPPAVEIQLPLLTGSKHLGRNELNLTSAKQAVTPAKNARPTSAARLHRGKALGGLSALTLQKKQASSGTLHLDLVGCVHPSSPGTQQRRRSFLTPIPTLYRMDAQAWQVKFQETWKDVLCFKRLCTFLDVKSMLNLSRLDHHWCLRCHTNEEWWRACFESRWGKSSTEMIPLSTDDDEKLRHPILMGVLQTKAVRTWRECIIELNRKISTILDDNVRSLSYKETWEFGAVASTKAASLFEVMDVIIDVDGLCLATCANEVMRSLNPDMTLKQLVVGLRDYSMLRIQCFRLRLYSDRHMLPTKQWFDITSHDLSASFYIHMDPTKTILNPFQEYVLSKLESRMRATYVLAKTTYQRRWREWAKRYDEMEAYQHILQIREIPQSLP